MDNQQQLTSQSLRQKYPSLNLCDANLIFQNPGLKEIPIDSKKYNLAQLNKIQSNPNSLQQQTNNVLNGIFMRSSSHISSSKGGKENQEKSKQSDRSQNNALYEQIDHYAKERHQFYQLQQNQQSANDSFIPPLRFDNSQNMSSLKGTEVKMSPLLNLKQPAVQQQLSSERTEFNPAFIDMISESSPILNNYRASEPQSSRVLNENKMQMQSFRQALTSGQNSNQPIPSKEGIQTKQYQNQRSDNSRYHSNTSKYQTNNMNTTKAKEAIKHQRVISFDSNQTGTSLQSPNSLKEVSVAAIQPAAVVKNPSNYGNAVVKHFQQASFSAQPTVINTDRTQQQQFQINVLPMRAITDLSEAEAKRENMDLVQNSEDIASDEAEEDHQNMDEASSSRKQTNSLAREKMKLIRDSYRADTIQTTTEFQSSLQLKSFATNTTNQNTNSQSKQQQEQSFKILTLRGQSQNQSKPENKNGIEKQSVGQAQESYTRNRNTNFSQVNSQKQIGISNGLNGMGKFKIKSQAAYNNYSTVVTQECFLENSGSNTNLFSTGLNKLLTSQDTPDRLRNGNLLTQFNNQSSEKYLENANQRLHLTNINAESPARNVRNESKENNKRTPVKGRVNENYNSILTEKIISKVLDSEIKSGGKRQSINLNQSFTQTPKVMQNRMSDVKFNKSPSQSLLNSSSLIQQYHPQAAGCNRNTLQPQIMSQSNNFQKHDGKISSSISPRSKVNQINSLQNASTLSREKSTKQRGRFLTNQYLRSHQTRNNQNAQEVSKLVTPSSNLNQTMPFKATPSKAAIEKRFDELYKDSQLKKQRLIRIQELKEQQKRYKEMQECTFSPKISELPVSAQKSPRTLISGQTSARNNNKSDASKALLNAKSSPRNVEVDNQQVYKIENGDQLMSSMIKINSSNSLAVKSRRSPREFFEDQLNFQKEKEMKLYNLRRQEMEQYSSRFNGGGANEFASSENREKLFVRLHTEEMHKLKRQEDQSQECQKIGQSTSRTREEIFDHLYGDFFIRDTKLKNLQCQIYNEDRKQNQEAIDLSRSNQFLAERIASSIKWAYKEMKLENTDELSFLNLVELLDKIGYIEKFDVNTKNLLNEMWINLIVDQNQSSESSISQRNLIIFMQAVHNLYLDSMKAHISLQSSKEQRQFGFFIKGFLFLEDELEAKKIHMHYNKLFWCRQKRLESQKKETHLVNASSPAQAELKFKPEINTKSKQIAELNVAKLEQAIRQGSGDSNVKIRVEDLLLSKGQVLQEKLRIQREQHEQFKERQFPFSPQLISPRFQDEQRMGSCDRKSTGNLVNGQIQPMKSRNVFDKLYAKALTQQKKPQQLTTQDINEEILLEECTFKPNLNQTQRINSKVQSILKQSLGSFLTREPRQNLLNRFDQTSTEPQSDHKNSLIHYLPADGHQQFVNLQQVYSMNSAQESENHTIYNISSQNQFSQDNFLDNQENALNTVITSQSSLPIPHPSNLSNVCQYIGDHDYNSEEKQKQVQLQKQVKFAEESTKKRNGNLKERTNRSSFENLRYTKAASSFNLYNGKGQTQNMRNNYLESSKLLNLTQVTSAPTNYSKLPTKANKKSLNSFNQNTENLNLATGNYNTVSKASFIQPMSTTNKSTQFYNRQGFQQFEQNRKQQSQKQIQLASASLQRDKSQSKERMNSSQNKVKATEISTRQAKLFLKSAIQSSL